MEPNTVTIPEKRYEELKTIEECFKKSIQILIGQYLKEFEGQKKELSEADSNSDKVKYYIEAEKYIEERLLKDGLTARGNRFMIDTDWSYLNIRGVFSGDFYRGLKIEINH